MKDDVSRGALRAILLKSFTLISISLVLFFASTADDSIWRFLAIIILVWVASEFLFIFLPNFIRHTRRWSEFDDYRIEIESKSNEVGPLKAIYSDVLDQYNFKKDS
jgi:hypothetical protein